MPPCLLFIAKKTEKVKEKPLNCEWCTVKEHRLRQNSGLKVKPASGLLKGGWTYLIMRKSPDSYIYESGLSFMTHESYLMSLSLQVDQLFQKRVGGGDDTAVGLETALRRDHVRELCGEVDV